MIVLMGQAGSGKSVQGDLLAKKLGFQLVAMGQYLREHLGDDRLEEMLSGKLLDDDEIIAVVTDMFKFGYADNDSVLDGFPRSMTQAQWLVDRHIERFLHIDAVVLLEASSETVRERLLKRGRQDDHEKAIQERIKEYQNVTLPALELLREAGIPIYTINAEQPIESVHNEIVSVLTK